MPETEHGDKVGTEEIETDFPREVEDMFCALKDRPLVPISGYRVVVVGITDQGLLRGGVNMEFPKLTLNQTIHGEQSLISILHAKGDSSLEHLYLNVSPCGYCRQFLYEIENGAEITIHIRGEKPISLRALLPKSFGPADLGVKGGLLTSCPLELTTKTESKDPELFAAALEIASRSYAPYSKAYGGVALRLFSGAIARGGYLENAAFNPSLSPLHSALSVMRVEYGAHIKDISHIVLVRVANPNVDHSRAIFDIMEASNHKPFIEVIDIDAELG